MSVKRRRLPRNPYLKAPFPWVKVLFLICLGVVLAWIGLALVLRSQAVSVTTSDSGDLVLNKAPEESIAPQKRVGIQVGHWKMEELPAEFSETSRWNTGGSVNGIDEWQLSLEIANLLGPILIEEGYAVDILPATIPINYQADAFITLHTDGNEVTSVSGFKIAANSWDETGKATVLARNIEETYQKATGMVIEPNITDDMTEYYAFNRVKYNHSIASTTPGVILEYGFLTNYSDRVFMINNTDKVARAIADGIIATLGTE